MGVRNAWMPIKPLFPGMRTVGPALTIRSVPGRDDLQAIAYEPGTLFPGHPDEAIEAVQPGDVVVLDGARRHATRACSATCSPTASR